MRPAVSVLQLDTAFPRVPGDVACPDTYLGEVEIIRVPAATVGCIVSAQPDLIAIEPFETAVRQARGEVIVTSCGFLSFWQAHLASLTERPFIASALVALQGIEDLSGVLTLTFDADRLGPLHFPGPMTDVVGLAAGMHLREVIAKDLPDLDMRRAEAEVVALVERARTATHSLLLLECTNLPPYRAALQRALDLPVIDILTCIETLRPGTVTAAFCGPSGANDGV